MKAVERLAIVGLLILLAVILYSCSGPSTYGLRP